MNEVIVNMENLTTEERDQLLALVEKGNKKPFEVWKPTKDSVWIVQGNGRISEADAPGMTPHYYEQGRAFETREQAEFFSEQEHILTQYRRLAEESWEGDKINWNSNIWNKYYLFLLDSVLQIDVSSATKKQGVVYFKTHKSLENAIKTIGEKNIIKYLF